VCVRALIACLESGDTRAIGKKLMIRGRGFDSHSTACFFVHRNVRLIQRSAPSLLEWNFDSGDFDECEAEF